MGVNNGGGGGGVSAAITGAMQGTAAARPVSGGAPAGSLYFATDTQELTINTTNQSGWTTINQISNYVGGPHFNCNTGWFWGSSSIGMNNGSIYPTSQTANSTLYFCGPVGAIQLAASSPYQAATATAGGGQTLPATVAGYMIIVDSAGTTRKIPYFSV